MIPFHLSATSSLNFSFQIKRKLYDDPRYDAVGSSSLREELFNTFLKGNATRVVAQPAEMAVEASAKDDDKKWQGVDEEEIQRKRKERAVKEREQRVKIERDRLEVDIGKSRNDVIREVGERDFRCPNVFLLFEISFRGADKHFGILQEHVDGCDPRPTSTIVLND